MNVDPALAALPVIEILESLHVPYYIGGSLASSYFGVARSTNDADIIAALTRTHVSGLVEGLEDSFYVDADMINDAIDRKSSFNVIHLATILKVDVFCVASPPEGESEMSRARAEPLFMPESDRKVFVASPEDVILAKLRWYGMSPSDRQWSDVRDVLRVQAVNLDRVYLQDSADRQGLSAALARVLQEAEL